MDVGFTNLLIIVAVGFAAPLAVGFAPGSASPRLLPERERVGAHARADAEGQPVVLALRRRDEVVQALAVDADDAAVDVVARAVGGDRVSVELDADPAGAAVRRAEHEVGVLADD